MTDSYARRNFPSSGELRQAVTTSGYAVGNLIHMSKKRGRPVQRTRIFVREWREFRNLTQEQLGEMTQRTKATISRIETGDIGYTREFLESAASALGTHAGLLLLRAPTDADSLPPQARRGRTG
jgi:DNA-binding XRE family transcriptional regulator